MQLRRRGITDVVLTGIATNIGVESTARQAYENDYNVIVVSDAVSTYSADAQTFALTQIFPRLGQVAVAADVETALEQGASSSAAVGAESFKRDGASA